MKKYVVALLFITSSIMAFAQKAVYETKIEEAVFTKGSLFKQEVFSVDNIPAFRIDALKITNLEKFSSTSGLRIVHKIQVGKELKTFNNFIDADEIDGIITSLQYMKTILKSKTVPANYTEIKYNTQSGFQVMLLTVLNDQNKLDWSFMAQTNLAEEKTLTALLAGNVEKLQDAFEQAKRKLQ